tara:strand:- start:256 stop:948 length:693 start_codon:yes stop_codon:yes gene_type:complete
MYQKSPQSFFLGFKDIAPLLVGTAPFGIIFGALCVQNQLTFFSSQSMSLFVFAGSSQLVALNLLSNDSLIITILIATFFINIRHLLYGLSFGRKIKNCTKKEKFFLSFFLTDESFSIISRYDVVGMSYYLGAAISMYINWQFWTFVGIFFGKNFENYYDFNISFLMVPAFLVILWPQIKGKLAINCFIISVFFSIFLIELPFQLGLFFSPLLGILLSISIDYFFNKIKSN